MSIFAHREGTVRLYLWIGPQAQPQEEEIDGLKTDAKKSFMKKSSEYLSIRMDIERRYFSICSRVQLTVYVTYAWPINKLLLLSEKYSTVKGIKKGAGETMHLVLSKYLS